MRRPSRDLTANALATVGARKMLIPNALGRVAWPRSSELGRDAFVVFAAYPALAPRVCIEGASPRDVAVDLYTVCRQYHVILPS